MKMFILIREDGALSLGRELNEGYDFVDGWASIQDIVNGDYGSHFELLSLEELQERIQEADKSIEGGF